MNNTVKWFVGFMFLSVVGMVGYKVLQPRMMEQELIDSSNGVKIKATIKIAIDSWIGYFPLCSKPMKSRMRSRGYNLVCIDDNADLEGRMQKLKDKEIQFAVATVDSYISLGKKYDFPATIVSVIDESKGGDALIAHKDKIKSIDELKKRKDYKIAFTPNSPSEHLLRGVAEHFSVEHLKNSKLWRVETSGSEKAWDLLLSNSVDAAVLWEPDVSRALQNSYYVKILGTEDTKKMIVDVLLVERSFNKENAEVVEILLENYYRTLKQYRLAEVELIKDVKDATDLSNEAIKNMLNGVAWVNLHDNATQWMGVVRNSYRADGLVDTIESTLEILKANKVMKSNPIPNQDPLVLMNTSVVENLYRQGLKDELSEEAKDGESFKALTVSQWGALREIGTLKVEPISFQSGTAMLDEEGKEELKKIAKNLSHYPNFRVVSKGHTGLNGDEEANYALSEMRANAVMQYLVGELGVHKNRIKAKGFGSSQPLPRLDMESEREYKYRLPRVELYLLKEVF